MWETPKHVENIMEKCRKAVTLYNQDKISELHLIGHFIKLSNEAENQKVTLSWDLSKGYPTYSVKYEIS